MILAVAGEALNSTTATDPSLSGRAMTYRPLLLLTRWPGLPSGSRATGSYACGRLDPKAVVRFSRHPALLPEVWALPLPDRGAWRPRAP